MDKQSQGKRLETGEELYERYTPGFKKAIRLAVSLQAGIVTTNSIIPSSLMQQRSVFTNVVHLIHFMMMIFFLAFYCFFFTAAKKKMSNVYANGDFNQFRSLWQFHSSNQILQKIVKKRCNLKVEQVITTSKLPGVKIYIFANKELSKCQPDKVLLHIHGGGFVASSPMEYFSFCAHLAKKLSDIVVVSIDYRKAPEYRFPRGFLDCYNSYLWLKENFSSQVLGLPKTNSSPPDVKIALLGDSAGGNLVVAVTLKLIAENLSLPAGLVAIYPALPVQGAKNSLESSRYKYQNDLIIPMLVLEEIITPRVYDNNQTEEQSHYMFLPAAPEELFENFPRTSILVGDMDPLYDDSVYLNNLLQRKSKNKPEMKVLNGVSHGFASMSDLCPEGKEAVKYSLQKILEYLN
eukprot:TRINITY_DN1127_c0_g1_i2.p1 TRINITY_DN1127_c0_g1~~TRINITY_DN1127_c0_g1_i2.p1  ORF type:complete len:405 (+),score=87.55 TRINITY_DN1127_c0_g1_i2:42-1256(+)